MGGQNRANLARIESSQQELLEEAETNRRNDPDENDDKSLKNRNREGFINIIIGIIIVAFLIGLFAFVAFVPH